MKYFIGTRLDFQQEVDPETKKQTVTPLTVRTEKKLKVKKVPNNRFENWLDKYSSNNPTTAVLNNIEDKTAWCEVDKKELTGFLLDLESDNFDFEVY
jgi:hypothetical protein